jgi:hypothetical protein
VSPEISSAHRKHYSIHRKRRFVHCIPVTYDGFLVKSKSDERVREAIGWPVALSPADGGLIVSCFAGIRYWDFPSIGKTSLSVRSYYSDQVGDLPVRASPGLAIKVLAGRRNFHCR